ncbi:MAG: hypothetical protein ACOCRX_10150, partial [Candidatus Woesearchaeota archaeon]
FNHLELLKEKNIKTVEQYRYYQHKKKKSKKVSYINDYRNKKTEKNDFIKYESDIIKLHNLIKKRFNEEISFKQSKTLIKNNKLINILRIIPTVNNYDELKQKLNSKNKRKKFKSEQYR